MSDVLYTQNSVHKLLVYMYAPLWRSYANMDEAYMDEAFNIIFYFTDVAS